MPARRNADLQQWADTYLQTTTARRVVRVLLLYRIIQRRSWTNFGAVLEGLLGSPVQGGVPEVAGVDRLGVNATTGDSVSSADHMKKLGAEYAVTALGLRGTGVEAIQLDVRTVNLGIVSADAANRLMFAADVLMSTHGNELSGTLMMRGTGTAVLEVMPHGAYTDYFQWITQSIGTAHLEVEPFEVKAGSGWWYGESESEAWVRQSTGRA